MGSSSVANEGGYTWAVDPIRIASPTPARPVDNSGVAWWPAPLLLFLCVGVGEVSRCGVQGGAGLLNTEPKRGIHESVLRV